MLAHWKVTLDRNDFNVGWQILMLPWFILFFWRLGVESMMRWIHNQFCQLTNFGAAIWQVCSVVRQKIFLNGLVWIGKMWLLSYVDNLSFITWWYSCITHRVCAYKNTSKSKFCFAIRCHYQLVMDSTPSGFTRLSHKLTHNRSAVQQTL